MKIIIRAHRRPDLLAQTLWSVGNSLLSPDRDAVFVMHDGRLDRPTVEVLARGSRYFEKLGVPYQVDHDREQRGVQGHAKWVAERLSFDDPFFANLTDDVCVSPPWLLVLRHLAEQVGGARRLGLLSGYTTEWSERSRPSLDGQFAHCVRCRIAPALGLINTAAWRAALAEFEPGGRDQHGQEIHWDDAFWHECADRKLMVLRTERSVIQHLGVRGLHGAMNPPAADFVGA